MACEVRRPPVRARLALHQQGVRGWCGWCGGQVEDKTPGRGWLKWWHDACAFEMGVIENPGHARGAVFARDKGICIDCGEDWSGRSKFVPKYRDRETGDARITYSFDTFREEWPWCEVTAISLWHVDHKIPLWKVQHMPDLERLAYFMLANLVTRCHRCHEHKTSEEAAERAHLDRMASTAPAKPKPKWVGRGFPPKGSRPFRRF